MTDPAQSEPPFEARAQNCAKVEPVWKVKHTVGHPDNQTVPADLFHKTANEAVDATIKLVKLEQAISAMLPACGDGETPQTAWHPDAMIALVKMLRERGL